MIDDGVPHTATRMGADVASVARGLAGFGIRTGDRIAIQAPNGYPWAIAAFAALQVGATIVPISTRYSRHESAQLVQRSRTRLVFAAGDFLGRDYAAELAEVVEADAVVAVDDIDALLQWADRAGSVAGAARRAAELAGAVTPALAAFVQFTSGTTGAPKGALLRHGALIATTREWIDATGLCSTDRYAVVAPFFHISGYKTGLLACLLAGAQAYPLATFDPDSLLRLIERTSITVLQGPPTLYLELIARSQAQPTIDISSLRLGVTGGTVVPAAVVQRMRTTLGFDSIITSYGITEASGVVTICRPGDSDEVVGHTSGRPIDSATVRIIPLDPPDDDGHGQIVVHSRHLMSGYLDDPHATARAIDPDGWLHTGDIGYLDDGGNLVLTGRLSDMLIVGGFNAYPAEIEAVLSAHDAVQAAAVIGVPDDRLGEVPVAFVVPDADGQFDEASVLEWARPRLASFKMPRSFTTIAALPLNAAGKVDKLALRRHWLAANG